MPTSKMIQPLNFGGPELVTHHPVSLIIQFDLLAVLLPHVEDPLYFFVRSTALTNHIITVSFWTFCTPTLTFLFRVSIT